MNSIGFLLSVIMLVVLYEMMAISIMALILDVISDYRKPITFKTPTLIFKTIPSTLTYKEYQTWNQDEYNEYEVEFNVI